MVYFYIITLASHKIFTPITEHAKSTTQPCAHLYWEDAQVELKQ